VKIENKVQLAHVSKELVQNFHKQVNGFEIRKFVVSHITAEKEVQARVTTVNNLEGSPLTSPANEQN
jgi:hypothetical protein